MTPHSKHSPQEITRAAVETAFEEFNKEGINSSGSQFLAMLRQALEDHEKTIAIRVITPSGDAGPLADAIADLIRSKFGRPVNVTQEADAALIGGVVIAFGDERLDLSVRSKLDAYGRTLKLADTATSPAQS